MEPAGDFTAAGESGAFMGEFSKWDSLMPGIVIPEAYGDVIVCNCSFHLGHLNANENKSHVLALQFVGSSPDSGWGVGVG